MRHMKKPGLILFIPGESLGMATSANATWTLPISRSSTCPHPEDGAHPCPLFLRLEDLFHFDQTVLHLLSH